MAFSVAARAPCAGLTSSARQPGRQRLSRGGGARQRGVAVASLQREEQKLDLGRVSKIDDEIQRQKGLVSAQREAISRQRATLEAEQAALVANASGGRAAQVVAPPAGGYGGEAANIFDLYQTGLPVEAVKVTAEAAYGALAMWLSAQQKQQERAFELKHHALQQRFTEERVLALTEQRSILLAEAAEEKNAALLEQRAILEAAHAEDKAIALSELKYLLECMAEEDKARALDELRAELKGTSR